MKTNQSIKIVAELSAHRKYNNKNK